MEAPGFVVLIILIALKIDFIVISWKQFKRGAFILYLMPLFLIDFNMVLRLRQTFNGLFSGL